MRVKRETSTVHGILRFRYIEKPSRYLNQRVGSSGDGGCRRAEVGQPRIIAILYNALDSTPYFCERHLPWVDMVL